MKFTEEDKRYLEKLRKNYPNHDIPTNDVVEKVLLNMKNDDEEVIDDLIIRVWDGIVELETI
jgi:uncharacterized protein YeeX (DUF496 family)